MPNRSWALFECDSYVNEPYVLQPLNRTSHGLCVSVNLMWTNYKYYNRYAEQVMALYRLKIEIVKQLFLLVCTVVTHRNQKLRSWRLHLGNP